jgi:tetratricopeptide (TPR) repeat protein
MTRPRLAGVLRLVQWTAIALAPWWYPYALDGELYALAALLLLVGAVWLWKHEGLQAATARPAALLAVWGLAQAALSSSPARTVESTLVLAAGLTTVLYWSHEARDEKTARWLAFVVLALCGVQGVFGVVQAAWTPGALYGRKSGDITSAFGSFENHNHFAGLMGMGALLAIGMVVGRARRARAVDPGTVGLIGVALALAAAHLASRSRGGLFALLAGGTALPLLWYLGSARRKVTRRELVMVVLAMLALAAFGWMAVPASTRGHLATLFRGPTDASGHYRIAVGAATLRLWREHPIAGSGLGTFEDAVTQFKRSEGLIRTRHAESDVLEFAAEGGLVGVALLAWLAVSLLGGFRDRMTEGRDPWRKGLATGALAAVVTLAAHSLFDFNLRIPSNALVFCTLAGLAAAPRSEPSRRIPRGVARIGAAVLLVLALGGAWRAAGDFALQSAVQPAPPEERLRRLGGVLSRHPYLTDGYWLRARLRWESVRSNPEMAAFRLERADDDLERAVRQRALWSYAWADLGWVRYMRNELPAAQAAFQRALELNPVDVSIGISRAEFLFRTGHPADGREELLRIRRYNPDWPPAAATAVAAEWGSASLK